MTTAYAVELLDDPATVLALAGDLLAADPVTWSVVASVTRQAADTFPPGAPRPQHPMWWGVVRDAAGVVVSLSMRTMPHPPHTLWVPAMPDDAARELATCALTHTARTGEPPITSMNGPLPSVGVFAQEVCRRSGGTAREDRPERLWEARQIRTPDRLPDGAVRPATLDDLDLVTAWFDVFHAEADAQAGRPLPDDAEPLRVAGARRWIEDGEVWLWDVDGEVVHLSGVRAPSYGVVRIGPVYTPPEHRGKGYATALVAEVSRRVLARGHRVCLYTDRGNPVSNHVYASIGFEPVLDQVNLAVEPAASSTKES